MLHWMANDIPTAYALPSYASRIPNSDRVIAPSGELWLGVGHFRSSGGGDVNAFGADFAAAGYRWTKELCEKDSDCDGLTNGQELGDPACIWKEGDIPQFDVGITHPGIADTERAVDDGVFVGSVQDRSSGTCKNFSFDDLPGHQNTSFVMPSYEVPTDSTTYVKYAFRVDFDNQDSYAIRFAPIVENPEVVHHMILYQCDRKPTDFLTPSLDGVMPCDNLVAAWAVGGLEQCLPPKVGIELDTSRPWYVIDMHYDNPRGLAGIRDSSGMEITTVPKAAVAGQNYESAGWLWAGANVGSYNIPPGQANYEITAECHYPRLPESGITVFAYALHAHKLGRKIWTEVLRPKDTIRRLERDLVDTIESPESNCAEDCDSRVYGMCHLCYSAQGCCNTLNPNLCGGGACCSDCTVCDGCQGCYERTETCNPEGHPPVPKGDPLFDLGCDTRYDFDLQEMRNLPEKQTIFPTDTLITHCVYDSTSRTSTTYGGDATDDEMCIGFYLYYPYQPNVRCMTANVELDVSDGSHTCQIPGTKEVINETLCTESTGPFIVNGTKLGLAEMDGWLQIHIITMLISMGILIPVGVVIPMFYRGEDPNDGMWFKYHRILQMIGVVFMIIGCAAAFVGTNGLYFLDPHQKLGMAIFVLAILQPLNALCRPKIQSTSSTDSSTDGSVPVVDDSDELEVPTAPQRAAARAELSNSKSMARQVWEFGHKGIGRFIVIASWINIFLGIKLLKSWYRASDSLSRALMGTQVLVIVVLLLVGVYKFIQKKRLSSDRLNPSMPIGNPRKSKRDKSIV